jgi:protein-S-isoprenylcysteine O-methyltransferase Ste14
LSAARRRDAPRAPAVGSKAILHPSEGREGASAGAPLAICRQVAVALRVRRKPSLARSEDFVDRKLPLRFAVREIMGAALLAVALFWPAGRLDWWAGWALVGVTLAWSGATLVVILRNHPALLAERLGPRKGAKPWDTAIMGVVGIATLARSILAGLDQRHGWTGPFPAAAQIAALLVSVAAYALVVWATACNAHFAQIVHVQPELGQVVATDGPYRSVRHPAYVGSILFELAAPILLGSLWALIPGGLNAILFVVRTALEDRALQAELPGYADYARETRFRLVPGIW